jgi:tetratricopeptide (TPR) repeat protein
MVTRNEQLHQAEAAFQSGRFDQADRICRHLLGTTPEFADALVLRALIAGRRTDRPLALALMERAVAAAPDRADCHNSLGQMRAVSGRIEGAIEAFDTAIGLKSDFSEAHYNLGLALRTQGRLREAVPRFQTAADFRPDWAEAHYALANTLAALGERDAAVDRYRQALARQPDFAEAWNNLGLALGALRQWEAAESAFVRAVAIRPDYAEALNNLGNLFKTTGRPDRAAQTFERSLRFRPEHPETLYNYGGVLQDLGRLEDARDALVKTIGIRPDLAMAHNNLGVVLTALGDWPAALDHYRSAHALEPDNPETCNNLGNLMEKRGDAEQAVAYCQKAISLRPGFAEAHNNLGVALNTAGRFARGDAAFARAVALRPDFTEARFNHAVSRLLLGDFAVGWEAYESRFERDGWTHIHPYRYPQPRWRGEPFAGRRLYVHDEQGFGDTIQFVRYLPRVKALGGDVILETRPPLGPLLDAIDGIDRLVVRPESGAPAAACDLVVPLMSLPGIFDTDARTIPAEIPYLHADPGKAAAWKETIGERGVRVGLVWAGSPNHEQDRRRSIPASALAGLLAMDGVRFFGLQKGAGDFPQGLKLENLGDGFDDFSDTAGAVANLDLVITVDTAVAHLAGAMGRPVWTLIPFAPDWRWRLDRDDTDWYPTMRLFRQSQPGDWEAVLERVAAALKAMIGQHAPRERFHRAARLFQAGQWDDAEARCGRILADRPDHGDTLNLAAILASRRGDLDRAAALLGRAVANAPNHPGLLYNLAKVLGEKGAFTKAASVYREILSLRPEDLDAAMGLARARAGAGDPDGAVSLCREILARTPDHLPALNVMGSVLGRRGDAHGAMGIFERAIAADPASPEAWTNKGTLLHRAGRLEAAAAAFDRALAADPNHADARFNRGQMRLLAGDLSNGWSDYEARFQKPAWQRLYPGLDPDQRWRGEPLDGQRLFVMDEQGLGDTLQFVRYLPAVKERCQRVVLCTAPSLIPILENFSGIDAVVAKGEGGAGPGDGDRFVHMLSLPGIFRTTQATIPAPVPYLHADPGMTAAWREKMPADGMRVGLVWAGNPEHANDGNRSVSLETLRPLLSLSGIRCFGLQKGDGAQQASILSGDLKLTNLGPDFNDFSDTAAAVANLDLVITVDTAVAHLAGAMGCPVWVMLPGVPDWRWMLDRTDCPWYPTMRLFRQAESGDWGHVVQAMCRALQRRVRERDSTDFNKRQERAT